MQTSILTDIFLSRPIANIIYPDYTLGEQIDAFSTALTVATHQCTFIDIPITLLSTIGKAIHSDRITSSLGVLIPYSACLGSSTKLLHLIELLNQKGINIALTDVVGGVDYKVLKLLKPRFVVLASTDVDHGHLLDDQYILATCRFYKEFGIDVALNTFDKYDSQLMTRAGFSYAVQHQALSA
jgi:hypothetical protein